ncbi:DUF6002 family protein [Streptomyces sp. NPDC005899]|uniref:DUF6002 family protein n=1 Tax=Streptomyces sp. NPDC005899 TaxID=3155716 RepID=UPI00340011E6
MTAVTTETVVVRAMTRYQPMLRAGAEQLGMSGTGPVGFHLPADDDRLARFHEVSDIAVQRAGTWRGHHVSLLDLMRNPGTRTTKTFASLHIVARAVQHIRDTGEPLLLTTPTSGNKGTALRDAVARAYAAGLATPDELRVLTVAPAHSHPKLRDSPLSADPGLRAANPLIVADVSRPDDVKALTRSAYERLRSEPTRFTPWFTLDLENYRIADTLRAYAEAELDPIGPRSRPRVHAHAVSSAFGLLGYHLGVSLLERHADWGLPAPHRHPGFLLVQQLATPDMVLSLLKGGTARDLLPRYRRPEPAGPWRQEGDPHFPAVTDALDERLDATFYTSAPPTSAEINSLVARYGGTGVVVSRRECLDHYEDIAALLAPLGHRLPEDPADIREWSLVKAVTGAMLAASRRLVASGTDLLVHASGFYTDDTLPPLRAGAQLEVSSSVAIEDAMLRAAR